MPFPFGQYNFHYGWARNLGQREEALVSRPCPTEAGNPDAVNQITSSFPAPSLLCLSSLLRLSPCLGLRAIHAPWARAQDKMFRQEPHVAEWHVCLCNELVVCLVTQHYKGNLVHHLGVFAINSYEVWDAPGRPFLTCCPPDGPDYNAHNSQPASTLPAGQDAERILIWKKAAPMYPETYKSVVFILEFDMFQTGQPNWNKTNEQ